MTNNKEQLREENKLRFEIFNYWGSGETFWWLGLMWNKLLFTEVNALQIFILNFEFRFYFDK